MAKSSDLWTAIRRVLPDSESLTAAVAQELGEPRDDVRLSVLIGMTALNGQLGPAAAASAAIKTMLSRLQSGAGDPPRSRRLSVGSLEALLAATRELERDGSLDLETIVAVQRASGVIAARTNRPMVALLHRYQVTRRVMWERCVEAFDAGRLEPSRLAELGRYLLLWNELTALAVTDGYRSAEREILARDAEARRSALQELLGATADDAASRARLSQVAIQHGLNPNRAYRVVAIAPLPPRDEDSLEAFAGRIGHLAGSASSGAKDAGIRLPAVLPLMGRICVLAIEEWTGQSRLRAALDSTLGPGSWVAVGSHPIDGVVYLAGAYADLVDATRAAKRLGKTGWIQDPELLALERLLLSDRQLADAALRRELGPLLDDRLGNELIATLQAYFDAGENVAAAGRELHLATRTVAYRLEKIESLLGHQLDAEYRRRLSAALIVYRLRQAEMALS
jgi:hypothetical protein